MGLDPEATPGIYTALPGTPDYMPPEAQGDSAKCGPSLDVFSFEHLSLFTINQSLVHHFSLQPTLMLKDCMLVQRLRDVSDTWTKLNSIWVQSIQ